MPALTLNQPRIDPHSSESNFTHEHQKPTISNLYSIFNKEIMIGKETDECIKELFE